MHIDDLKRLPADIDLLESHFLSENLPLKFCDAIENVVNFAKEKLAEDPSERIDLYNILRNIGEAVLEPVDDAARIQWIRNVIANSTIRRTTP